MIGNNDNDLLQNLQEQQTPALQMSPVVIDSFREEFYFLSNFYPASIWVDGERHPTVEHAFQAAKALQPASKKLIREAKTAAMAKKLAKSVALVPNWDTERVLVMRRLLQEKFKNPLLRSLLLATEDIPLIEGNTWHDYFWGVCNGQGQNVLGKMLMEVRDECRKEEDNNADVA